MRLLGSIVLGVCVLSGCAPKAATTIPSGEALKEKLAKEGNSKSFLFHAPLDKVLEQVKAAHKDVTFTSDGSATIAQYSVSEERQTWEAWSGYVIRRLGWEPIRYNAPLKLRLESQEKGATLATAEADQVCVEFIVDTRRTCLLTRYCCCCLNPIECVAAMGNPPPDVGACGPWRLFFRKVRYIVPSNTVPECMELRRIGGLLKEPDPDRPFLKMGCYGFKKPEIEVIP